MTGASRSGTAGRTRRLVAGIVGMALVSSLMGVAGGRADAAPNPGSAAIAAKKGAPAAPVAAPVERCAQRQPDRPNHEWLSCIGVQAQVTSLPRVGEEGVITVAVTADVNRARTAVQVDLPSTARFTDAGRAALSTTRAAEGVGTAHRASVNTDLVRGRRVTYSYRFVPDKPGPMHIRVRAISRVSAQRTDAGSDDVFITVADENGVSRLGADPAPTEGGTVPVTGTPARLSTGAKRAAAPVDSAPLSDDPKVSTDAPSGQACVTGGWFFVDNNGVTRPATNQTVEVWDKDTLSDDDRLVVGVVGFDGRYSFCVSNDDGELFDDSTQEIYLVFATRNTIWRVRNTPGANNDYAFTTEMWDSCNGCDLEFGNRQPADNSVMRGLHAFESLNKLWLAVQGGSGGCFDRNDTSCRQMVLNWTSTSTDGTYYSLGGNDIHLAADDPNAPTTVIHEGSHALMDDAYEDDFPPAPNCNPHGITTEHSQGCAWTEGLAEWLPAMVLNDPYYRWPDGGSLNLENPTWDTSGWATGDDVEGRVAGAMIDISDAANEGPYDFASEGGSASSRQYTTFINTVSDTFNEFLTVDRVGQGFPLTDTELGSAYQNTIDYGFRNPLVDNVAKQFGDSNGRIHAYGAATTGNYWSVVGVRPVAGVDYDLNLFDDRGLAVSLATSTFGGAVDFVAIDGNKRPAGDYYPRVNKFGGGFGGYAIEFDNGSATLPAGSLVGPVLSFSDIVTPYDVLLAAGASNTIRVVPSAGQDLALVLMRSEGTGLVLGRGSAVAASDFGGPGAAETISYTESVSQWDGLMVVQKSGSGSFTLLRDTNAPTGTVTIGAGNPAATNSRNVTLQLTASDPETGVTDMRVAVDGVVDTESWESFSTSKAITLPAGDGLKTVAVQFRNGVGLTANASDTITLDTRPNYTVSTVANPPTNLVRGQVFSKSATVLNSGPTAAAASSALRFYLSTDTVKDGGDLLLAGSRTIAALAAGGSSTGSVPLTVPAGAAAGTYFLIACADDTGVIAEYSESDNCRASQATATLKVPDYRVTTLSSPPATVGQGGSFDITDATKNTGSGPTVATSTEYVLSLDTTRGPTDVLIGLRPVPVLAGSTENTGTLRVTLPVPVKQGAYFLLACADSTNAVAESNEANNCKTAAAKVTVEAADLVVSALQNPPATRARGATFNVNETTKNIGNITSVGTRTRFYLAGGGIAPVRLTAVHVVPALVAGGINAGTFTLTVPTTLAVGSYTLIACADDTLLQTEGDETNNCRSSLTPMNVT